MLKAGNAEESLVLINNAITLNDFELHTDACAHRDRVKRVMEEKMEVISKCSDFPQFFPLCNIDVISNRFITTEIPVTQALVTKYVIVETICMTSGCKDTLVTAHLLA
jgi:hypothetical protein